MKRTTLACVFLVGSLLSAAGCSTNRWARAFEPVGDTRFPAAEETAITFEQVPYPDLERSRDLTGFETIGVSQFRAPTQKQRPGSRDSDLRKHAAKVGAHHIRWAEVPIGTVGAGYVHQGTGHVASVTRTDYLAVYYRRAKQRGEQEGQP